MGNSSGSAICGGGRTDPAHLKLVNENRAKFEDWVQLQRLERKIKQNVPGLRSEAERVFSRHTHEGPEKIANQQLLAEKRLKGLREQVSLKFGSEQAFERRAGASLQTYLDSKAGLGKFREYQEQAKSEFSWKKDVLIRGIESQKDLYIQELRARMSAVLESVPGFSSKLAREQEEILLLAKSLSQSQLSSGPKEQAIKSEQRCERDWHSFEGKVGVHLLEKNLVELEAVRRSENHFSGLLEEWLRLVTQVV